MTAVVPGRPLLRYHGGKWLLGPWIISHFPPHRVYVEPFGGAASVLLQKPRSYAEVYNDLDGEVVNLFRVVRESPSRLTRALVWTPFSRAEFQRAYEPTDDAFERARRLVIRGFMGFGSAAATRDHKTGFRSNVTRSGTTPATDWKRYPPTIRSVARRMRGVTIDCKPAIDVIAQYDSAETLHYVDPPYTFGSRSMPRGAVQPFAYRHEMDDEAHVALASALASADGMVVLSGYRSALYADLYRGWRSIEKPTHADGARPRTEVLWLNDAAWDRLRDTRTPLFAGGNA